MFRLFLILGLSILGRQNISMNEELVLVRQALVIIIVSCAAARLVREFVGPV